MFIGKKVDVYQISVRFIKTWCKSAPVFSDKSLPAGLTANLLHQLSTDQKVKAHYTQRERLFQGHRFKNPLWLSPISGSEKKEIIHKAS